MSPKIFVGGAIAVLLVASAAVGIIAVTTEDVTAADEKVITTDSGLKYVELKVGDGKEAKKGSKVKVHYTGTLLDGTVFDSSVQRNEPAEFQLDQVIAGWTEGVPGMKVGGTRRLVIPGAKAYGEAPAGYVPGSTDRPMGPLVFDIELVSVQNP